MSQPDGLRAQLAELRAGFDEGFERLRERAASATESLVLFQAGARRLAVRVGDILGIERAGKIAPVPATAPALVGVAAVGGALLPVFSIGRLLGDAPVDDEARWFVRVDAGEPIALGFATFDGFVRVPTDQVTGAVVRTAAGVRGILDVGALVASLRAPHDTKPEPRSGERTV